ncbi:MAG: glycosyltransferase [Lachnospirales bacterium]
MNDETKIDISVIVPVYNVDKYLDTCIFSLVNQTYEFFEIILVNDGSTDDSLSICNRWAKKDSRVKIINKENGGLSSARNSGLDNATGEFIAFVDADDYVDLRFLEVLINLCIEKNADISMCEYICVDKYIKYMPRVHASFEIKKSRDALYELCCVPYSVKYVTMWNKLYRGCLFDNLRFPVGKNHEDEYISYKLILNVDSIATTNEYLYYYLKHQGSITSTNSKKNKIDAIGAFEERSKILYEKGFISEYEGTLKTLDYLQEEIKQKKENNINISKCYKDVKVLNWEKEEDLEQNIVIYGAGEVGMILLKQLKKRKYKNIRIVDNRWYTDTLMNESVEPIYKITNDKVDTLIIANKSEIVQKQIYNIVTAWGINKAVIKFVSYN